MKLIGGNKLLNALHNKHKNYMTAGEKAIRRGLEIIRGKAVQYEVNVDTGRLKGSLGGGMFESVVQRVEKRIKSGKTTNRDNTPQAGDAVLQVEVGKDDVVGIVGTNVPYAKDIEYGNTESQGFFQRAIDDTKDDVDKVIKSTLSGV